MRGDSWSAIGLAVLGVVGVSDVASAAPPAGHSARLFGVHDWTGSSVSYLEGATDSCDKGWLTHLTYIDGDAATITPPDGISMIIRLDWSGSDSVPPDAGTRNTYVDRFVESVQRSPDVHVWIVGNEPNFTISGPWPGPGDEYIDPYVGPFVDAYARIRDRVHDLSGHENDVVLLPAPSPWSPCFLEGLARMIRGIDDRGVAIDGFAIHPGTRAASDTQRASRVTSDEGFHSCDIGPYTDGSGQFRVYQDFVRVIDGEGHGSAPIYITESAHNTDEGGIVNHVNEDRGFFDAIYSEIDTWNASNGNRIRAITPYRWTTASDGTGRDHSIEGKPALQADHLRGAGHTWTETDCGGESTGCTDDGDCGAGEICDLGGGTCTSASGCPCDGGEVCRRDGSVCVPASRGPASITFDPPSPDPGSTVTVDVFATSGYTNIGLEWEGPLPGGSPSVALDEIFMADGGHHWTYDAEVPAEGTYRATFTADPGGSTVYAIGYLNVGEAPPVEDGGVPGDDGGTGDTDGGSGSGDDGGTGGDGGGRDDPGDLGGDGCGCASAEADPRRAGWWLLALVGVLLATRRRR